MHDDRLTDDDLLEFQLLLERDDWFERLAELTPGVAPKAPPNDQRRSRWTPWSKRTTHE